MSETQPLADELAATRAQRVLARRVERQERYLHYLKIARRTRLDNDLDPSKLDDVIRQGGDELENLAASAGGRINPRKRPLNKTVDSTCTVFIDECGAHNLNAKEKFDAFGLTAVLIPDETFQTVDRQWKRWKRDYLGSSRKRVHEPDIRDKTGSFWCGGDPAKQERAISSLDKILNRLDYTLIACVVRRKAYRDQVGGDALDESLPQHVYLMAFHFLMERVAMALDTQLGGSKGRVVVEGRGPLEDARLQYEFARLFLEGTTYISATYFRNQFLPGLEFRDKASNSTGLQLADLTARPCADKIIAPDSSPARWDAVRENLCPGQETAHSILGLKVIPWDEIYANVWKS